MNEGKPFEISKEMIVTAYKRVKANHGAEGIDGIDIETFEKGKKNNLYKLWNRMSSGSYFPKPVRGVSIPKKNGKTRLLGIPTVEDRIAQMTTTMMLEPSVEPIFDRDSYGYRPNKTALGAVKVTRERCWKYPWVVEIDIKRLFDYINHDLMMKAVRKHTSCKWAVLYIERFLKAPVKMADGELVKRDTGTPQGGVISPLLANLFMHYAFDRWMRKEHNQVMWARYADDIVIHCKSETEAQEMLEAVERRMKECKLEINPEKSRIVYCHCGKFPERHEKESFEFLGYAFQARKAVDGKGEFFKGFLPAVSKQNEQSLRGKIKEILKNSPLVSINELANYINPIIRGWANYFRAFYPSRADRVLGYVNHALSNWIRKRYKSARGRRKSWILLTKIAKKNPELFYHWSLGNLPTMG